MFHRHFTFDRMNRNAAIGRIVVSVNENCPEIDQCSRGMSISTGKYTSSSARSGPRRIQTIRATSAGNAIRIFCIISRRYLRHLQALNCFSLLLSSQRPVSGWLNHKRLVSLFHEFPICPDLRWSREHGVLSISGGLTSVLHEGLPSGGVLGVLWLCHITSIILFEVCSRGGPGAFPYVFPDRFDLPRILSIFNLKNATFAEPTQSWL